MIISIASGKGGTGKTTVASNLALVLSDLGPVQFCDADVEGPNGHIFLKPVIEDSSPVMVPVPQVDQSLCTFCGRCAEICAFNALAVLKDQVLVFDPLCHGCGGCTILCPTGAITERPRPIGVVERGTADGIRFAHGRLNVGEAMSPPVIRAVKREIPRTGTTIIDSAPGTACAMVEAVRGSDICLLVTEPTPFGHNDLVLAAEVVKKLGIPAGVVLNRCDMGDGEVERYCEAEALPILSRIPYDRQAAEAYARGIPAVVAVPGWKERFVDLAGAILELSTKRVRA